MKIKFVFWFVTTIFFNIRPGISGPADSINITLTAAIQEALSNNEQLKDARAVVNGTEAALAETEGAFLPKLDANFSYVYQDIVPGFKKEVLGNVAHDLFPAISVSQLLYSGGKLRFIKDAAIARVHSQEMAFQNQILELKFSVALRYYELISLLSKIRIIMQNKEQLLVHQQYARLLVEASRMSELELNRLTVEMAAINGALLNLQNNYQMTSNELGVLLGKEPPSLFHPVDSLTVEPLSLDTTKIAQIALNNNPIQKKFDWEIKKATAQINIQQAERLPQVSATAYFGYEFGLESFAFDKNDRYFVGLTARMPLFDGGVIRARVNQAASQLESVQWQQKYFVKTLSAQVNNLYLRVKEMEAQMGIQEKAIEQARQSYRMALIEYHAGRRSNTDLLDIQKSLLNSELTRNEAIVNYNKSKVNLLYLMGIL